MLLFNVLIKISIPFDHLNNADLLEIIAIKVLLEKINELKKYCPVGYISIETVKSKVAFMSRRTIYLK